MKRGKTNYIYFAVFFKENYLPKHKLMDENIHRFSLWHNPNSSFYSNNKQKNSIQVDLAVRCN